ncbi:MAG: hypothetical protein WEE89_02770 [Gemmatimonadota bacterium]
MVIPKRAARIFIALPLLAACDGSADRSGAIVTRDSAGIRIVESSAPLLPDSSWQISSAPVLRIGTAEGDSTYALHRVYGAVRLSDGRIVIAHQPVPMLRWFDSAGVFLLGTGRGGGGPGEFSGSEGAYISALWGFPGDSIGTWHHESRRLQVYDDSGRYARAVTFELPRDMPSRSYPALLGPLRTGMVLFLVPPEKRDAVGIRRDSNLYIRYRADGTQAGLMARRPGFTRYTSEISSPRGGTFRAERAPLFAPAGVGQSSGDLMYYTRGDLAQIEVFDTLGSVRLIARRAVAAQPVTEELVAAYKQEAADRAVASGQTSPAWWRSQQEREFDQALRADSVSHYRRLEIDRDGNIWAREPELPGMTTVKWYVFDADGRWVTTVNTPRRFQVYEIGRDYMLGSIEDELGVEYVVLFKLDKKTGASDS